MIAGALAPVSTIGRQATSIKTMAANPLLRIRSHAKKTFGETFGAATGVNAPSYKRNHGPSATSFKHRLRIHQQGGAAATVAGGADPGFHIWPTGHINQDNGSESASSRPVPCQKDVRRDVRRRDRGQRPQLQKKPWPLSHILQTPATNPPTRRRRRHCSWGHFECLYRKEEEQSELLTAGSVALFSRSRCDRGKLTPLLSRLGQQQPSPRADTEGVTA